MEDTKFKRESNYDGIAIIGMAGRFPGASSVDELWANLVAGVESISVFSDVELIGSGLDPAALRRQGTYVPARGIIDNADCFDASFFNVHPKEAEVMDPQQRVFLEICWKALEHSGYPPNNAAGVVGVFAGATFNTYHKYALQKRPDLIELVGSDLVMYGNEKDYLTTRVAYKLGLKGPALNVSTACSTSLVAVSQACQSLLTFQSDIALAGGVSITVPQKRGYFYDEGNIGSKDGHTRSFDANAAGTVFSNGVAVVVLKRLEDAVRDGDSVYAVIKGAAINNDGSERVSFGAPGVDGQSEVIAMAHALSGVDPESITYVEAHGTATPLGDPIELAALTKAFRMGTAAKQFCALGSLKSNIGHLDVAAGVTGLIKTALALHHKLIPASLNFTEPNSKLDIENSPFYVNTVLQEWNTKPGTPRRAGVSSFGTGGTNAHVVLEEAPELQPSSEPSRSWQLFAISAKTPEALERATVDLASHLRSNLVPGGSKAKLELADAAFTLQTGRSAFGQRRIAVCQSASEGADILDSGDSVRVFTQIQEHRDPPVIFMFPGQGAQYAGMGAELYRTEQVFRDEVDRCTENLRPLIQLDLRSLLFPAEGTKESAGEQLKQTRFTQPALFVIEYALAKLWMSWGIKPAAMIGHSVGEYVAGCLAEVFSLNDALALVAKRAALVQALPVGSMLSVRLPEMDVLPLLDPSLAIAAINSPNLCVVSGPGTAVRALEERLTAKGVMTRHLHTSHAFHSSMMEPVLAPFTEVLRAIKLNPPKIPYVSNVTARWISVEEAVSPEYWAGHVRDTVRFADGMSELMKDLRNVFLEVGPGQTLSTLARQHPSKSAKQTVLSTLPVSGADETRGVLETLGRLWMTGVSVDWDNFHTNERRHRVALPTYSFERHRFWPDPVSVSAPATIVPINEVAISRLPVCDGTETAETPVQSFLPVAEQMPGIPRKERLVQAVRTVMEQLSGYNLSEVDASMSLLELGLDSLLLTQAAQLLQRKFSVTITFRQLMEELGSLETIAEYLDATLPQDVFEKKAAAPVSGAVSGLPAAAGVSQNILEQILQQQQMLTNQVLALLGRSAVEAPAVMVAPAIPRAPLPSVSPSGSHGPFRPVDRGTGMSLSPEQTAFLESLIARYTKRTSGSKKMAGENRPLLADPRSVAGFKQIWKEMVYPIVSVRSDGSKIWDVDGNEYVDFVMGFGSSLFGHRPPFVVQAVHEQLDKGFEIGPIQPLAYEVAALLKEFTGMERFAFTNTGSEAVLAATRVARTVTGRDKIAVFAGAYHGIFDEVLFRPLTINGEIRTAAIAPGIPESALTQVIVLEYGNPQSLDILRARGSEIAAVLIEPVQSRRLDLQPREFIRELRNVTRETGTALVFDEVVTGFRLHPGGSQAYFGVRGDLATYGKVIGGGLPIGVVSGDARFLDALDGGQWQYGDASFPEVGVTFFAGTCMRHPLALAAAKSVLTYLKEQGPELQSRLAERTVRLADDLRSIIAEFGAPYQIAQFSSLITLTFSPDQKFAGLLFYLLRLRGVHIWENRLFIITTAHTESDFSFLLRSIRESLAELRSGGFLPLSSSSASGTPIVPVKKAMSVTSFADSSTSDSGKFPLTEAQKEIWLAAQMGGSASVAYNESLILDFRGGLDVDLLRRSAIEVVCRHPILMANMSRDGQWQNVPLNASIEIPLMDFSHLSEADRNSEKNALLEREVSEAFDLDAGPLVRMKIVRLSEDFHIVVMTAHHIVCDGWSCGVLVSELATVYSARKRGQEPELETPLAFKDYALGNRPNNDEGSAALDYWRSKYSTIPEPLDLPADRSRPVARSARAATRKHVFDSALHQALKRFAGQQRTTLVVVLLAGLEAMLHRLTGQSDIVVGLGAAGQAVTGNTSLVGHCVNLLPIRADVRPESSFQEHLAGVKKSVLDAYDHHQCTVGSLLQHVPVPRSTGRPPLVEVIFNLDRDPSAAEFQDLKFSCVRNPKRALHFDLFFNFSEGPGGLYVECDYNTDLFSDETIGRWLGHYETLIEGVVANPANSIARLPLLTEAERNQLVVDWNKTSVEAQPRKTLHRWFEEQVAMSPDTPAITFQGSTLTYNELNRRSNKLAHYLKSQGVGPDILVGLFVERSMEMVVAILGVLKAGGAYLPIDPVYPKERLDFMLDDAKAPVVLTQSALASILPETVKKIVCLDTDGALFENLPDVNLEADSNSDNLAYVIYTSGSTGKPKGTLVTHHNVARLMQSTERWFQFDHHDVWTFFHSHAFDFSVWELWGALLYGGRVVIVPYLTSRSPQDFYHLLLDERVTVLNQTPSAFRQFIQAESALRNGRNLALRYVIFGGEALEMQSLKPWFDQHGDSNPKLVNMYGITETTVHVTYRPLNATDLNSGSVVGVPIPDLQVYILDACGQPVPIGVKGEIVVGGAGVARGYLNRDELTRERFVPDTFSKVGSARLYRSGDLARLLPNRDIEYFGRLDQQVKIRGFRIELGEIEAVLSRNPSVDQCVVVARENSSDDRRLVAYIRTADSNRPSAQEFRDFLKKGLPEYMIPNSFVFLDSFPLTPNGKVDRKALPDPSGSQIESTGKFAAPRDPIEQMISKIWARILRVNRVGIHDNFFELGGHSLLAVRIIVEIERVFHKRLPLATLIQSPTVAQLSDRIREENWKPSWSSLVPIRPGGFRLPLFLVHSHGGNVLEYFPLAANLLDENQPVFALQARGLDGQIPQNQSIEKIASAYLEEIRSFQPEGPYVLGGFCFGGLVALEAAQQLKAAGQEVALLVLIQTVHPNSDPFAPEASRFRKLQSRVAKRIDLERENYSLGGSGYLQERWRRLWDIGMAKVGISVGKFMGKAEGQRTDDSMRVILEALGIEHDKAYAKYHPMPYTGNTVIFRAAKQLPGLSADPFLGWNGIIGGNVDIIEVPGHQQNMLLEPNVSRLADEVGKKLERVVQN